MKSPLIQRVVLVLISVVVSIALAEVILRIWPPSSLQHKAVRRADPVFHHSLIPSSRYVAHNPDFTVEVRTNSLGFRDREHSNDPSEAYNIIVLGDSFVEGYGVPVESCFVHRLESQLNADTIHSRPTTLYNFGVAGYSPVIEYLVLKHRGLALKPNMVILCYDMNDVQEDVLYAQDAEFDSTGMPLKINPSWPSFGTVATLPRSVFKTYLQEHSYVYSLLASFVNRAKPATVVEPGNIDASRYAHSVDSTAERWQKFFEQSQSYVKMIRDLCSSNGITFVLVTYPRGHQVNPVEWTVGRKYSGLDSLTPNSAIFASLQLFAQTNAISFLNMTPTFRSHSKGDLYYPYDGHWTSAGHALAAEKLYEFLISNHLLPN
ncbi:MAG: uncharacterized protein HW412_2313 [Bacteroidetes bacterium]|nr:uncharacterized protein [Bacteroidota bacterium]